MTLASGWPPGQSTHNGQRKRPFNSRSCTEYVWMVWKQVHDNESFIIEHTYEDPEGPKIIRGGRSRKTAVRSLLLIIANYTFEYVFSSAIFSIILFLSLFVPLLLKMLILSVLFSHSCFNLYKFPHLSSFALLSLLLSTLPFLPASLQSPAVNHCD